MTLTHAVVIFAFLTVTSKRGACDVITPYSYTSGCLSLECLKETERGQFKVTVHPKTNILTLFTHLHNVQNLYGLSVIRRTQKEKFNLQKLNNIIKSLY